MGWLGFWSSIVACGTALISGHIADKLIGHFKLVLLILLTISTGSFLWFCFICTKVIPFSIGKQFISICLQFHELCIHAFLRTKMFYLRGRPLTISYNWVGGYIFKIIYHLSKIGLTLGKNQRLLGG